MKHSLPTTSQGHFFEHHRSPKRPGLSIEASRFTIIPPTATPLINIYPLWVIDYSFTDCGICRIGMPGNPWLHRPPGLLHLYAPNTRFSEHFPEIAIRSAHITFFEGEVLDLTKLVQNNLGFGRFLDPGGETGQLLIEAAVDASAYGEAAYWSVMAKLLQIVARLHAAKPDPTSGEMLITDPAMDAGHSSETTFRDLTRKYLQHNMDRNVSIGDLARHMNLSKSTLAHKYRKLIGETPMKTLTALRINAVKNLMTKGSSLKFIAAQTGFYDEFHLSKVFKKLTGLAPTAYLKQVSARLPKA